MPYYGIKCMIPVYDEYIANARLTLRWAFKSYNRGSSAILGGPGVMVECDESVLYTRQTIRCPTSADDEILDTVWILGAIDNIVDRNF